MQIKNIPNGGLDFSNHLRNSKLTSMKGFQSPKMLSTGTTLCGVKGKDFVVIGADTRATNGPVVADRNCSKIHFVAPNIYCAGAGTAADTENVTGMISSDLSLHRYALNRESRVVTALTMTKQFLFRYQGYISAALVLGGVDCTGAHLHTIYPHGSTDSLPFVSMGSGSLAAMAFLESGYKDNLTIEEAKKLCHSAICGGIYNDLGSGSNVDLCVITKGHTDYLRGYDMSNQRKERRLYEIPLGTTPIISEKIEYAKSLLESQVVEETAEEQITTTSDAMVDE